MEFLRFGSSIPGSYWGCCAVCIIQNFQYKPTDPASIQLVNGDGGQVIMRGADALFLGKTYEEVFRSRLRIGTFSDDDMPNHGFLAILTSGQLRRETGKAWLKILKEEGFEFIRTIDNSVYSGAKLLDDEDFDGDDYEDESDGSNLNYLFGLFRNIGRGASDDPFLPPPEWTALEDVVPEPWQFLDSENRANLTQGQQNHHTRRWHEIGRPVFYTEAQLDEAKVPVTYAGQRSKYPQQSREMRAKLTENNGSKATADPFAHPAAKTA